MGSIFRKLRIHSLLAQIEASRLYSVSLANQFDAAPTNGEKTKIAQRYDDALKQTHTMQLLLELLERQERENLEDADSVSL